MTCKIKSTTWILATALLCAGCKPLPACQYPVAPADMMQPPQTVGFLDRMQSILGISSISPAPPKSKPGN